jgi:uridine phosphorylase
MVRGYTVACGGFYGPQGRQLRADIADPDQNKKIESFEYEGMKICNFEMESSALAGLASLLGHRAMTCCMVIANRYAQKMNTEYKNSIDTLIQKVLERIRHDRYNLRTCYCSWWRPRHHQSLWS